MFLELLWVIRVIMISGYESDLIIITVKYFFIK